MKIMMIMLRNRPNQQAHNAWRTIKKKKNPARHGDFYVVHDWEPLCS